MIEIAFQQIEGGHFRNKPPAKVFPEKHRLSKTFQGFQTAPADGRMLRIRSDGPIINPATFTLFTRSRFNDNRHPFQLGKGHGPVRQRIRRFEQLIRHF
jgi:hypothetical protein